MASEQPTSNPYQSPSESSFDPDEAARQAIQLVDARRYARYFVISIVAAGAGLILALLMLVVARMTAAAGAMAVLMVCQIAVIGGLCCALIFGITWLVRHPH